MDFTRFTSRTIGSASALRERIDEVRQRGFSLVDGELDEDLIAAAVTLELPRPMNGSNVAINVSSKRSRLSAQAIAGEIVPELQRAAERIVTRSKAFGQSV
jgi:IclR family pca regulon transcriptional regulator